MVLSTCRITLSRAGRIILNISSALYSSPDSTSVKVNESWVIVKKSLWACSSSIFVVSSRFTPMAVPSVSSVTTDCSGRTLSAFSLIDAIMLFIPALMSRDKTRFPFEKIAIRDQSLPMKRVHVFSPSVSIHWDLTRFWSAKGTIDMPVSG